MWVDEKVEKQEFQGISKNMIKKPTTGLDWVGGWKGTASKEAKEAVVRIKGRFDYHKGEGEME